MDVNSIFLMANLTYLPWNKRETFPRICEELLRKQGHQHIWVWMNKQQYGHKDNIEINQIVLIIC